MFVWARVRTNSSTRNECIKLRNYFLFCATRSGKVLSEHMMCCQLAAFACIGACVGADNNLMTGTKSSLVHHRTTATTALVFHDIRRISRRCLSNKLEVKIWEHLTKGDKYLYDDLTEKELLSEQNLSLPPRLCTSR